MPTPSPFHERTAPLCRSYAWKDWAGYCAVCSYDTSHEREYFAFRETYRYAANRLRAGATDFEFPVGAFPPRLPIRLAARTG